MKKLIFQVAVGQISKLYDFCVKSVEDYAKEVGADYILLREPKLKIKPNPATSNRSKASWQKYGGYLPIYEKENIFEHINNYDQLCVIDADIWVRPGSPDIFTQVDQTHDLGAVFERELPLNKKYRRQTVDYSKKQLTPLKEYDWKWNPSTGGEYFNSGVIVYNSANMKKYLRNETPSEFMKRPEFQPFVDGVGAWKWQTYQIMLTYWAKKESMNVKHLDWKYNSLFKAVDPHITKQSHFIHFFMKDLLPKKGENIEELIKLIQ